MLKDNFEVKILVNGNPLREYFHEGKTYIEGRRDTEFTILVKNKGYKKITAVPTVDGLSVLNGEVADFNSRGYIIEGYGSVRIDGWRKSDNDVAKFVFCDKEKSYSVKSGANTGPGVIGVAIFEEAQSYYDRFPNGYSFSASNTTRGEYDIPMPHCPETTYTSGQKMFYSCSVSNNTVGDSTYSANLSQPKTQQQLGTGWGNEKYSPTRTVAFRREDHPRTIFEIFYDSNEGLRKRGVDVVTPGNFSYISSFPGEKSDYCKPPKY